VDVRRSVLTVATITATEQRQLPVSAAVVVEPVM